MILASGKLARVSEGELRVFSEDKLKTIRSFARFSAEDAAWPAF